MFVVVGGVGWGAEQWRRRRRNLATVAHLETQISME
jgi:hypothetical protein